MAKIAQQSTFRAVPSDTTFSDAQLNAVRGDNRSIGKSKSITPLAHLLHKVFYPRGATRTKLLARYSVQRTAKSQSVVSLMKSAKAGSKRAARQIAPALRRMAVRSAKVAGREGGANQIHNSLYEGLADMRKNDPEGFKNLTGEFLAKHNWTRGYVVQKIKTPGAEQAMRDIETNAALVESTAVLKPVLDAIVDAPSRNAATAALAAFVKEAGAAHSQIGAWALNRPYATELMRAAVVTLDDAGLAKFAQCVHDSAADPQSGVPADALKALQGMVQKEGDFRLTRFIGSAQDTIAHHLEVEAKTENTLVLKALKANKPQGTARGDLNAIAAQRAADALTERRAATAERVRDQAVEGAYGQNPPPGRLESGLRGVAEGMRAQLQTLGDAVMPGQPIEAKMNMWLTKAFQTLVSVDMPPPLFMPMDATEPAFAGTSSSASRATRGQGAQPASTFAPRSNVPVRAAPAAPNAPVRQAPAAPVAAQARRADVSRQSRPTFAPPGVPQRADSSSSGYARIRGDSTGSATSRAPSPSQDGMDDHVYADPSE